MVLPSTKAEIASKAPTTDSSKAYSAAEAPRQSLRKILAIFNALTTTLCFSMPGLFSSHHCYLNLKALLGCFLQHPVLSSLLQGLEDGFSR